MSLLQDTMPNTYQVLGKEIAMFTDPDVWSPYSAKEMMTFLTEHGYLEEIEQQKVLDLGTGSGIIGILCGILGAKEITLSDYSESAIKLALKNASYNHIPAQGIVSDCFKNFEDQSFDFIISNPPVQPYLYTDLNHPEKRINSAVWNEAGADGRLVLDALLEQGKNHLNLKGQMITSCSTRHGHRKTIELLEKNWKNHWQQIYTAEHAIDAHYHAPYMPVWKHLQALDLDLRVYQKDAKGRHFAKQITEEGIEYIITELVLDHQKISVKLIKNMNIWEVRNAQNQLLAELPLQDTQIPQEAIDTNWYYQYILIKTWY